MYKATPEQIAKWKTETNTSTVIRFTARKEGKSCYCRKPTRKEMSFISQITDSLKFNAALLKACWLDGDMEIQTNDDIFLGISGEIQSLLEFAEIEVEKL